MRRVRPCLGGEPLNKTRSGGEMTINEAIDAIQEYDSEKSTVPYRVFLREILNLFANEAYLQGYDDNETVNTSLGGSE